LDKRDIEKLFLTVAQDPALDTDANRKIFSLLIQSTLRYRDEMLSSRGIVVTVGDVRTALAWLVPVLATGNIPETDNKISLGLLDLWMDELKKKEREGMFLREG
jgi:hypothetical protein